MHEYGIKERVLPAADQLKYTFSSNGPKDPRIKQLYTGAFHLASIKFIYLLLTYQFSYRIYQTIFYPVSKHGEGQRMVFTQELRQI